MMTDNTIMSNEIMFADMLNHYSLKTSEISDLLSSLVVYLNKCVAISRESWQSDAAEKFILEISNIQQYINQANNSLDELMRLFNVIKDNQVDSQIDQLSAEISAAGNN